MSRPGTTLTRSSVRPARSARTGTGPAFIVGPTGTADTDPLGPRKAVTNLAEYAARFGSRASHTDDGGGGAPAMFDFVDYYFQERGSEIFVSPATYHATPSTYETNVTTALGLFTRDLGPGQVAVPGRKTPATRLALAVHAEATSRIAVSSAASSATVATVVADATIASITPEQERRIGLFAPDVIVPVSAGVTRTISPEAIVMGLMSRRDGEGYTPNQPAAGALGESAVGLNVAFSYSDVDRATLNVNGVNILRPMYDGVRVYGYRTLADPSTDDNWVNLGNARLFMAIEAAADVIAERFVFRQLDGNRLTTTEFGGALTGMLLPYWQVGSLFGTTPDEAFHVEIGPSVNTDETIEARELHASIALRMSEFAEEVIINVVKSRITEAVA